MMDFNEDLDITIGEIFRVIDTYYDVRVAREIKCLILSLIEKHRLVRHEDGDCKK